MEQHQKELPRIYSAPRRFDTLTILGVSTIYAIVLGILVSFKSNLILIGVVILFPTLVATGQAVLWKGTNPRLASVVTGVILFILASFIGQYLLIQYSSGPVMAPSTLATILSYGFIAISGAVIGYLTGALIGGVFLVIDGIRETFFVISKKDQPPPPSSPYDD